MGIFKSAANFLFKTPEGNIILGAVAFGGGYLLGEYIEERVIQKEKNAYECGIKCGMHLRDQGYNPNSIEVIIEQDPGLLGKRRIRTITTNKPEPLEKPANDINFTVYSEAIPEDKPSDDKSC